MRLGELLRRSGTAGRLHVPAGVERADPPVASVCEDSREVRQGSVFCCIPGLSLDGHDFASAAASVGAVALVAERPVEVPLPQIIVPDARAALGPLVLARQGSPQERLRLAAVTGSNGKTTVAHLLGGILGAAGGECAVMGTLDGALTTPRAGDLARRLAAAAAGGAQSAVLEVSSHGLSQKRVEGLHFAVAAFTNLSVEHLDYHRSMEEYFEAKRTLFEPSRTAVAVVCTDDDWGRRLAAEVRNDLRVCSIQDAEVIEMDARSSRFRWRGLDLVVPLGGMHNVANAVVAATSAEALGATPPQIVEGLKRCGALAGRFEVVADAPAVVIVDFAHSPAALEQLLSAGVALAAERSRLTVVFGCGGERDRGKRAAMGAIASRLADRVIVTSDNPRSEDPAQIAGEITAGMPPGGVEVQLDRRLAIAAGIDGAGPGDVVIVAGKGHETRQTAAGRSLPFDDRIVVKELLAGAGEAAGVAP